MNAHELARQLLELPEEAIILFLNEKDNKYEVVEAVTLIDPRKGNIETPDVHIEEERLKIINAIKDNSPAWGILNLIQRVETQK